MAAASELNIRARQDERTRRTIIARRRQEKARSATTPELGSATEDRTAAGDHYYVEGSPYAHLNLADGRYRCQNRTVRPGDRLYLPFGTPHRAIAGEAGSVRRTALWEGAP
jgi:hypothetical protein